jgi:hypothetical protein
MGFAVAAFGWRPREFWASTPHEFYAALESYERLNCAPDDT